MSDRLLAAWPLRLPDGMPPAEIAELSRRADELGSRAQYGWGHSVDFGPFRKEGLLGDAYLWICGLLDAWEWWPRELRGLRTADVGCYTGGAAALMAARGAEIVHAVDELPGHVEQAALLAEAFRLPNLRPVTETVYQLPRVIPAGSLDLCLFSGVLYHLSDMLVGLHALRELLKPGGILLMESNVVDDPERSYANFGRFFAGMWWQPSTLCVRDMCEFMGYTDVEVRMYRENRCLVRAVRSAEPIPFRRGMNWPFEEMADRRPRSLDPGIMAPAREG
jgi:SAM-dependent methyltransferase